MHLQLILVYVRDKELTVSCFQIACFPSFIGFEASFTLDGFRLICLFLNILENESLSHVGFFCFFF
jgi:hypothetical protein